ncbi:hypothetical protein [Novosphingobium sp.]|uniref:hypothetical protein n=1 Tax=Novosphingobium sp. TaxID=1874826 RepID=UPI0025E6F380|nr:hypothetical protein [Novosphingobium sp.]MCC6927161.1 hypothetical protein [Novosphingobium sp.]
MPVLSLMAAAAAVTMTPGSQLEKDVHCVAAIALSGDRLEKEEDKSSLITMMFYYLGRIAGEAPGFDLAGALTRVAEIPNYETQAMPADLIRCAGEMEQVGAELEAVGKALEKSAK